MCEDNERRWLLLHAQLTMEATCSICARKADATQVHAHLASQATRSSVRGQWRRLLLHAGLATAATRSRCAKEGGCDSGACPAGQGSDSHQMCEDSGGCFCCLPSWPCKRIAAYVRGRWMRRSSGQQETCPTICRALQQLQCMSPDQHGRIMRGLRGSGMHGYPWFVLAACSLSLQ